jgi:hypothetical protein
VGSGRYGAEKCLVAPGGFSLTSRARARRQNYAEDGRPGITVGTRTWVVTMLQIPGEHKITEQERQAVSQASISFSCPCTTPSTPKRGHVLPRPPLTGPRTNPVHPRTGTTPSTPTVPVYHPVQPQRRPRTSPPVCPHGNGAGC